MHKNAACIARLARKDARRERGRKAAKSRWAARAAALADEPIRSAPALPAGEFLLLLPCGQRWHYTLEQDPRDARMLRVRDAATGAPVQRSGLERLWRAVQQQRVKPEGYSREE